MSDEKTEYVDVERQHCKALLVVDVDLLRVALMAIGLHIVTEAEKRVLDATGDIGLGVLEAIRDKWSCAPAIFHPACLAELARRTAAYRSEIAPLRTRAEVDAEIAAIIRYYHRHITRPGWKERCDWDSFSVGQKNELERLCREPTRDSGPSSAEGERPCRAHGIICCGACLR